MNLASLILVLISAGLFVVGFYLIYPPLALIAGGLLTAGIATLLWQVDDKE